MKTKATANYKPDYRGIDKETKKWVYGYYAEIPVEKSLIKRTIINPCLMSVIIVDGKWIEVISKTVSICVGHKDIKNQKIYAGDRIGIDDNDGEGLYEVGIVSWDKETMGWLVDDWNLCDYLEGIEIINDIYENYKI